MKIKNKIIIDFAVEYAEVVNGSIVYLQKINKVLKYKRAMLPYELFSSSGATITSCGRYSNEVGSGMNTPSKDAEARRCIKHKKQINLAVKRG